MGKRTENIVLFGASGRMGRAIINTAAKDKAFDVVCGVANHDDYLNGVWIYNDIKKVPARDLRGGVSAVIDFSDPNKIEDSVDTALKYNCPLILGTSGYTKDQQKFISDTANKIKVFQGGNFRFSMHKFMESSKQIARLWDGDITIEETHNEFKKGPSATAITIAKCIDEIRKQDGTAVLGDVKIKSIRTPGEAFISKHKIIFENDGSGVRTVTMEDKIVSRDPIARDVLKISKLMNFKTPDGIYNIERICDTNE
jgi:4-hydroxy-tetrahydrodipicolinate reductase